ncbi:MAG: SpoVR family protein [Nevskia sp.]|nr:SpoVR family protein [Nevskia sp.]
MTVSDTSVQDGGLSQYRERIETLARRYGLDFYPVDFELVPKTFMMEVAVYGLPVRMPHWSFGVRYIYQYVQHRMGHSHIFEVVFPGNPNRAYLERGNSLSENTLVTAHVLGHADFSRNNALFARMQKEVGDRIVEQAAARAHQIEDAIRRHGQERVEAVLDAALALEQHIDLNQALRRPPYPEWLAPPETPAPTPFESRYGRLPGESGQAPPAPEPRRAPVPPQPEADLLWFIAHHAPELEDWARDIFLAVREESYYFYPVFACHIMNEGWASYWHARLLREADFLPQALYLEAIKAHSDVVRPYAGEDAVALTVNPYHLGFAIWEHVVERRGLATAFRIRAEEDDFGFIRNCLDEELAHKLKLFKYQHEQRGSRDERVVVGEAGIDELRETLLAPRFNYGAPRILAVEKGRDGSLSLRHDVASDRRGLDLARAEKVLQYIHRVWRRPVRLETVGPEGAPHTLSVG